MRILYQEKGFRIIEQADTESQFDDLCGDSFNPLFHPNIPAKRLEQERVEFRETAEREGVYGYTLERWNPAVGAGWEHVDSCWGFVGQYDENAKNPRLTHHIVPELRATAEAMADA